MSDTLIQDSLRGRRADTAESGLTGRSASRARRMDRLSADMALVQRRLVSADAG